MAEKKEFNLINSRLQNTPPALQQQYSSSSSSYVVAHTFLQATLNVAPLVVLISFLARLTTNAAAREIYENKNKIMISTQE